MSSFLNDPPAPGVFLVSSCHFPSALLGLLGTKQVVEKQRRDDHYEQR
jgi:hypothetical protein